MMEGFVVAAARWESAAQPHGPVRWTRFSRPWPATAAGSKGGHHVQQLTEGFGGSSSSSRCSRTIPGSQPTTSATTAGAHSCICGGFSLAAISVASTSAKSRRRHKRWLSLTFGGLHSFTYTAAQGGGGESAFHGAGDQVLMDEDEDLQRGNARPSADASRGGGVGGAAGTSLTPIEEMLPGLPKVARRALADQGITHPSPIQELAWDMLWEQSPRKSCVLQAPTGSGKTLGFLLPMLRQLGEAPEGDYPILLIVTPTRELGVQLRSDAESFGIDQAALVVLGAEAPWWTVWDSQAVIGTPFQILELLDRWERHDVEQLLGRVVGLVLDELDALMPSVEQKSSRHHAVLQEKGMWPAEALVKRLLQCNKVNDLLVVASSATPWVGSREKLGSLLYRDPLDRFRRNGSLDARNDLLVLADKRGSQSEPENRQRGGDEYIEDGGLRGSGPFIPTGNPSLGYTPLPQEIQHYNHIIQRETSYADAVVQVLERLKPRSALVFTCPNSRESVRSVWQTLHDASWDNARLLSQSMFKDRRHDLRNNSYRRSISRNFKGGRHGNLSPEERASASVWELWNVRATIRDGWENQVSYLHAPVLITAEESSRGMDLDVVEAVIILGMPASGTAYVHMAGRTGRLPYLQGYSVLVANKKQAKIIKAWEPETGIPVSKWKPLPDEGSSEIGGRPSGGEALDQALGASASTKSLLFGDDEDDY